MRYRPAPGDPLGIAHLPDVPICATSPLRLRVVLVVVRSVRLSAPIADSERISIPAGLIVLAIGFDSRNPFGVTKLDTVGAEAGQSRRAPPPPPSCGWTSGSALGTMSGCL